MSPKEFSDKTAEQVQQEFFLKELAVDGRYLCYRLLKAEPGSVVLFQYLGHIIGSAILCQRVLFQTQDEEGYRGTLNFDPKSIRVFDPVGASAVSDVWPEFKRFGQWMMELDANETRNLKMS